MAKFNVEIELGWFEDIFGDDDNNIPLDEKIKNDIIANIVSRVSDKIKAEIEEKAQKAIDEKINTLINDKINSLMDGFLTTPRDVTDEWGDVVRENITIIDRMKEKCTNYLHEKVDDYGKPSTSCRAISRLEYLLKKEIDHSLEFSVKSAAREVKRGIQEYVDEVITLEIGKEVKETLGIDKIIGRM